MKLENILKHQWFLNIKAKLQNGKVERKSKQGYGILRTIIELQEKSSLDLNV